MKLRHGTMGYTFEGANAESRFCKGRTGVRSIRDLYHVMPAAVPFAATRQAGGKSCWPYCTHDSAIDSFLRVKVLCTSGFVVRISSNPVAGY